MTTQPSDSSEAKDSTKGGDEPCADTDKRTLQTADVQPAPQAPASNAAPRSEPLDAASLPMSLREQAADAIESLLWLYEYHEDRPDRKPALIHKGSIVDTQTRAILAALRATPATPGQQTAEASPSQPEAKGTPRTDAEAFTKCTACNGTGWAGRDGSDMGSCPKCRGVAWLKEVQGYSVPASFARQLETELAAERAARQKAETERDEYGHAVDAKCSLLANIGDTLRSRDFDGSIGQMDERVIAMAKVLDATISERDALQAKLAEVEADKVRLDWQRNMLAKVFFEDGKWICCIRFVHGHECWNGDSPRAAIDAAREASKAVAP